MTLTLNYQRNSRASGILIIDFLQVNQNQNLQ